MKRFLIVLSPCLLLLFAKTGSPDHVVFSNDGPLGVNASQAMIPDHTAVSVWSDLNHLGIQGPVTGPWTTGFRVLLWHPTLILVLLLIVTLIFLLFKGIAKRLCVINCIYSLSAIALLAGCLTGFVDPHTSPLMMLYPILSYLFPILLMATMISLEDGPIDIFRLRMWRGKCSGA